MTLHGPACHVSALSSRRPTGSTARGGARLPPAGNVAAEHLQLAWPVARSAGELQLTWPVEELRAAAPPTALPTSPGPTSTAPRTFFADGGLLPQARPRCLVGRDPRPRRTGSPAGGLPPPGSPVPPSIGGARPPPPPAGGAQPRPPPAGGPRPLPLSPRHTRTERRRSRRGQKGTPCPLILGVPIRPACYSSSNQILQIIETIPSRPVPAS